MNRLQLLVIIAGVLFIAFLVVTTVNQFQFAGRLAKVENQVLLVARRQVAPVITPSVTPTATPEAVMKRSGVIAKPTVAPRAK